MNKEIIDKTIAALRHNHFEAFFAHNTAEASAIFFRDIFPGLQVETVSWGDSETMKATGVLNELQKNPELSVIDSFAPGMSRKQKIYWRRQALLTDLFLTAVPSSPTTRCRPWPITGDASARRNTRWISPNGAHPSRKTPRRLPPRLPGRAVRMRNPCMPRPWPSCRNRAACPFPCSSGVSASASTKPRASSNVWRRKASCRPLPAPTKPEPCGWIDF